MKSSFVLAGVCLGVAPLSACGGNAFATPPISAAPFSTASRDTSSDDLYAAGVKITPDFRDLGRARPTTEVRLSIVLRYRHESELEPLVLAQSDRGSPYFRRFLTNAEFNAYFAPSARAQRQVIGVLTSAGFKVVRTFGNRTVVEAVGPSAAAERLFATQIDYGLQDGHGQRYKNVTDAVMPASLRGLVTAVVGLDDLVSFASHLQIVPGADEPSAVRSRLRGPNGELGPLGFQRAYDEPFLHGYDGSGRAIANTMTGDINNDDLEAFLDYFQIKPAHRLHRVAVDGGRFGRGDIESTVDLEEMIGMSPGAQVYMYSFPDFTEAYAVDTYDAVVDDNLVDAMNASWGGCEYFRKRHLGHYFAEVVNRIVEQGEAKGITFAAATGDFGWTQCKHNHTIETATPGDAPHILAVGGTTLHVDVNGYWKSETAWRKSAGGVSVYFHLPSYQRGVDHVIAAGRNVPDIAFDANPHVGFAGRWHHIWVGAGGTSIGGPMWAGLEAQMDQYIGGRIGFVHPQLYALLMGPSYDKVFHDIRSGDNGGFRALKGYDLVTGIGSPIGFPLAQALK